MLVAQFSKEEIKVAIFQMKHNAALGPDGFPAELYQVFWTLLRRTLMALFREFHEESLALNSLNFGTITLLPKSKEAN